MGVRPAVPGDVAAIAAVHVDSWRSTYRGLVPDGFLAGLSIDDRAVVWQGLVLDQSDDRGVLVFDDDGTVLGFCHYCPSRDSDAGPTTGEVTSIYLVESHWRSGHGSDLLAQALRSLGRAGFDRATLWVLDDNVSARSFYEAHGWRHDGEEKVEDRGSFELRELRYGRPL